MTRISTEEAFRVLARWSEERAAIQVALSRPVRQRAAMTATVNEVLPHSKKALLVLRDENGEDVTVTVSLEGAEWQYEDAGTVLPEFSDMPWVRVLAATFLNGSRYAFGELATAD